MNNYSEKFEKMRIAGKVAAKTLERKTLSKEDELYLSSYFYEDICKLEKLTETEDDN